MNHQQGALPDAAHSISSMSNTYNNPQYHSRSYHPTAINVPQSYSEKPEFFETSSAHQRTYPNAPASTENHNLLSFQGSSKLSLPRWDPALYPPLSPGLTASHHHQSTTTTQQQSQSDRWKLPGIQQPRPVNDWKTPTATVQQQQQQQLVNFQYSAPTSSYPQSNSANAYSSLQIPQRLRPHHSNYFHSTPTQNAQPAHHSTQNLSASDSSIKPNYFENTTPAKPLLDNSNYNAAAAAPCAPANEYNKPLVSSLLTVPPADQKDGTKNQLYPGTEASGISNHGPGGMIHSVDAGATNPGPTFSSAADQIFSNRGSSASSSVSFKSNECLSTTLGQYSAASSPVLENVLDIDRPQYWDIQDKENTYFESLALTDHRKGGQERSTLHHKGDKCYADFSTLHQLVHIPQQTILKKDVPSLSLYDNLLSSKLNSIPSQQSLPRKSLYPAMLARSNLLKNTTNAQINEILRVRTPFQNTLSSALQYFDWRRNSDAFYYLKLYLNFMYLKGHTSVAGETFDNVIRSLHVTPEDILHYNKEIWAVVSALRSDHTSVNLTVENNVFAADGAGRYHDTSYNFDGTHSQHLPIESGVLKDMLLTTGVWTIKVCSNYCMANFKYDYIFKCSRCGSTDTVDLEYLSPRTLVSHMMENPTFVRSIKSTPLVKTKSVNDIWNSEVVKKLREKGYLKSPYEFLFNVIFDSSDTFKTSEVELIQVSLMILNLPPSEREKKENLIPVFCFPKYTKNNVSHVDISSYLQVLVDDAKEMGSVGFRSFDSDERKYVVCKGHIGFITGDPHSMNHVMGYTPGYSSSLCTKCDISQIAFPRGDSTQLPSYRGVYSFHIQTNGIDFKHTQVRTPYSEKGMEWYNQFSEHIDPLTGTVSDAGKIAGISARNVFLELDTVSLPDSFIIDVNSLYYDFLARKFCTLMFSRGDEFYKRAFPKSFRSSIEAHNRFCYVMEVINEAMPYYWLEQPFEAEKILKGTPGAMTVNQIKRFLEILPLIYHEVFKSCDEIEDKLVLELNMLLQIVCSREISESVIDFLEISFSDVIMKLESVITSNYSVIENLSIFSTVLHYTLHIAKSIRKCGNLRSLCTNHRSRAVRDFSGIEEQQDLGNVTIPAPMNASVPGNASTTSANGITALQVIGDTNIQNLAVRLLVPSEFSLKTGSISLVSSRKNYQSINRSWEVLSASEKQDVIAQEGDAFLGVILFSKLNRLVWRFFKRNKTFQLCSVNPETGAAIFPGQNDIFLDSSKCERFKICQFESNGAQAQADSVIRLKSKDKARYGLAQDFVRVRFTVANPDGTNIREMEKSLVLFTELTTQLKKLGETPEAVDPRKIFNKGTQFGPGVSTTEPVSRAGKCQLVYGYYYTFPYNSADAADYESLGRLYCDPPAEQRWDVAPVDSISNPVHSVPIVSKDRKSVNVYLVDTKYNCELHAGNKAFSIDRSIPEYDINEIYEKEMAKVRIKSPSKRT